MAPAARKSSARERNADTPGTSKPGARRPRSTKPGASEAAASKPSVTKRGATKQTAAERRALTKLRASDPVLARVIEQAGPLEDSRDGRPDRDDHYGALVRAIVGQQLSVLAARAIYGRLTERFGGRTPTALEILADDPDELRAAAGLSRAKVAYLRSLAEHVQSGELELERLSELDDEAVTAELVAVKGLGTWSAHMFLMFHLERPDVMPVGDLGIRRAMQLAYGLQELPDPETMYELSDAWRPHRTLACRYLWRSLRNEPT
jgi:DNA-3-methyladenine glycosylase II